MGVTTVGKVRGITAELLKDLPLIHVPISVQMSATLVLRQGLQALDVVGIRLHQHTIVINTGRDEAIILRVLPLAKATVDK